VRQFLIEPAYRAAGGGRGKVFVVVESEIMSHHAQSALLKTLEEPPGGVTIILLCTREEDLLATTRSRCQVVRFRPLPLDFVADALAGHGVEPAEARFWAALTDGSLGRSRRLAETGLYALKRKLVGQLAEASPLGEQLVAAVEKRAKAEAAGEEGLAGTVASRRAGELLLGLLASVYRDALRVACGVGGPVAHADQRAEVEALARRFGPDRLGEILAQLSRYEQLLWRNLNAKLLWHNVAATCASAAPLEV
jgi:DNA polymerase-3 subunit delta'